jgi:segregation and condensation protein B
MTLKHVIEALVFASPKPLLTKEIVAALKAAGAGTEDQEALDYAKTKEAEVAALLEELKIDYVESGRAFQLAEQINGWALVTDPAAAAWVRQLYPEAKPTRLSGPALETLAIIAYRQPVTRADIEAVRGVAVDGVMQALLERSLVKIAGRAEVPGRPLLYSTTEYFLQHFGLKAVDELPNADELRRVALPTAPITPVEETPATEGEPSQDAPPASAEEAASTPDASESGGGAEQPENSAIESPAPPAVKESGD